MEVTPVPVEECLSSILKDDDSKISLPKSCPLCSTGFDKIAPKLLPCLHSFCQPCLEEKMSEQQSEPNTSTSSTSRLKCPKCGQEFLVPSRGIASLIDNQFILEVVANPNGNNEAESHVCTSCEDNSSSTSYCLNCTEWLCDACVQAHQRVRVTKDHEIKSKGELAVTLRNKGRTERALYCQRHPCEKLTLFCANCERLTCRDCQLHEHKEHKYQFVKEAAGRYREYFRKRLANLGEKIAPLSESIEAVRNSTQHLDHKTEVVANEIKTSTIQILKAARQRELVLLNELKALVHFKRKMLTKQSKDLQLMQEILNHNFEFAKYAVMEGSDVSLLYSKRQLGSRIQNLLSLKYRVGPVAQSDLKFAAETVKIANLVLKAGSVMTPTGSSQMGQRISPGNLTNQHSAHPHQNNGMFNAKGNPIHSMNAFNHRLGGVFPVGMKPSSKVYPNVVTSQMGMTSNIPFFNSSKRIAQQLILPKVSSGTTSQSGIGQSSGFHMSPAVAVSGTNTMRKTQNDGSGIPLHHITDSNQKARSASVPGYEQVLTNMRKSSSPITTENKKKERSSPSGNNHTAVQAPSSSQNSSHGKQGTSNNSSTTTITTTSGIDQSGMVPTCNGTLTNDVDKPVSEASSTTSSTPELPTIVSTTSLSGEHTGQNSTEPSPKPLSNPISPHSVPKHSPSLPQNTHTPPPISPGSSSKSPPHTSPSPSPLPTFLDPVMQNTLVGNVKIKIEKDCSSPPPPLPMSPPYSMVKKESQRYSSCSFLSACRQDSFTGPPSNNSSNEDWCAVCHNGGELLCCDTCPKVFHLLCHVPTLTTTPSDTWSCGLCESLDNIPTKSLDVTGGHKRRGLFSGMTERNTKMCEKVLLELFCHPDSVPFHEKVSKAVPNYYKIIQKPMDLSSIKTKLQSMHFEHYSNIEEFITDCTLIFTNCALFNDTDSEVGKMGKRLSTDFEDVLRKYLPHYEPQDAEPKAKRRKDDM